MKKSKGKNREDASVLIEESVTSERGGNLYLDSIRWGHPDLTRDQFLEIMARMRDASSLSEWNHLIGELVLHLLYSTAGESIVRPLNEEERRVAPELQFRSNFLDADFKDWATDLSWRIRWGYKVKSHGRPRDWSNDSFAEKVIKKHIRLNPTFADLAHLVSQLLQEKLDTAQKRVARVALKLGIELPRGKPFGDGRDGPRFTVTSEMRGSMRVGLIYDRDGHDDGEASDGEPIGK